MTCWKVFTAAYKNIINVFQRLGDNEDDTMDSIRDGLVQFVELKMTLQVLKKDLIFAVAR